MAFSQRFVLRSTAPGLPPERACAGCGAVEFEVTPPPGEPAEATIMTHEDNCPEVSKLTSAGA
ncbi:MAG TPA: hypothetical protein VEV45_20615 [Streptosporangiaceae bacterium]|nr:hypothetical protein [Streptosporangiaceae bacterium]